MSSKAMAGLLAFACWLLFSAPHAAADDSSVAQGETLMQVWGVTASHSANGQHYDVIIEVDDLKALEAVPLLQTIGVLNADLERGYFRTRLTTLCATVALVSMTLELKNVYEIQEVDGVHAVALMRTRDDYGKEEKHILYSLNFTRQINDRIDWDHFQPYSLAKIAPNFQFSPWANAKLQFEDFFH